MTLRARAVALFLLGGKVELALQLNMTSIIKKKYIYILYEYYSSNFINNGHYNIFFVI